MIIALDIVITLRFSINCSVVICSPIIIIPILREASSETYVPWIYFTSYKFPIYNFSFLFPLICNLLLFVPYTKNITLPFIISIRSHFSNNCEGIDNPFVALGASWCLFVQVFGDLSVVSYWYLGSQKLREILTLLCCSTLSSSREKPTQDPEVARATFQFEIRYNYLIKFYFRPTHFFREKLLL